MSNSFRRVAVALALAAMALRMVLPVGWMPNPAGFAQSPLIICPMDLPQDGQTSSPMDMDMPMDMSMESGDHRHPGQGDNHQTCPFEAAPHIAASFAVAQISAPIALSRFHREILLAAALSRANVYQPHAPRGPPRLA